MLRGLSKGCRKVGRTHHNNPPCRVAGQDADRRLSYDIAMHLESRVRNADSAPARVIVRQLQDGPASDLYRTARRKVHTGRSASCDGGRQNCYEAWNLLFMHLH